MAGYGGDSAFLREDLVRCPLLSKNLNSTILRGSSSSMENLPGGIAFSFSATLVKLVKAVLLNILNHRKMCIEMIR